MDKKSVGKTGKMVKVSAMVVLFLGIFWVGYGVSQSGNNLNPAGAAEPVVVSAVSCEECPSSSECPSGEGCVSGGECLSGGECASGKECSSGEECSSVGGGSCGSSGSVLSDPASGQGAVKVMVPTDNIVVSSMNGEIQEARIQVNEGGASPGIIVLKKGIRAKLDFFGEKLDQDNYRIIVPAYNARMELKSGVNVVEFIPETDFIYYNWTYKYFGVVLVEEEPSAAGSEELKKRAANQGSSLEFSLNRQSSGCGGSSSCGR